MQQKFWPVGDFNDYGKNDINYEVLHHTSTAASTDGLLEQLRTMSVITFIIAPVKYTHSHFFFTMIYLERILYETPMGSGYDVGERIYT